MSKPTRQSLQPAPSSDTVLECPEWLPARARIVVTRRTEGSIQGEARLGRRRLAQLLWTPDGQLGWEQPLGKNGKPHGIEVERDDDGRVTWCAQWVNGQMHGPVMQFDARGLPMMVTDFVRGRGIDIWIGGRQVAEIREMADGRLHGIVRWGDPRKPSSEERFFHGERHGIFREWEPDGRLRSRFPQYYVNDRLVSLTRYKSAQAKDESLPPYCEEDDANQRPMPEVVRDALKRARSLRRDLAFVRNAQRSARIRP
jgi:hypothetical protein